MSSEVEKDKHRRTPTFLPSARLPEFLAGDSLGISSEAEKDRYRSLSRRLDFPDLSHPPEFLEVYRKKSFGFRIGSNSKKVFQPDNLESSGRRFWEE